MQEAHLHLAKVKKKIGSGNGVKEMRRMMKKILTLMSVLALFVGCENDKGTEDNFVHTGAFLELGLGADTRTSIGDKNADGKTPFLWSTGDALGVYCEQNGTNNKTIAIPAEANGEHVAMVKTGIEFNGTADHVFYFYYPYDGGQSTSYSTTVNKTLAAKQNGQINANGFMWQTATANSANPRLEVDMAHTFAYLRFFVVDEAMAEAGVTITNVTFSNETTTSAALAGSYTANLTDGDVSFTSASNSIFMEPSTTMNVLKAVPDSKIGYPAMVINPSAVKSTDKARVTVSFSNGVTSYVEVTGKTFSKQKIYNITLKTLHQDTEFKIQVVAWDEVDCEVSFN